MFWNCKRHPNSNGGCHPTPHNSLSITAMHEDEARCFKHVTNNVFDLHLILSISLSQQANLNCKAIVSSSNATKNEHRSGPYTALTKIRAIDHFSPFHNLALCLPFNNISDLNTIPTLSASKGANCFWCFSRPLSISRMHGPTWSFNQAKALVENSRSCKLLPCLK